MYIWRRKISPLLYVFVTSLLILYYEGFFPLLRKSKTCEEMTNAVQLDLKNAEKRIIYLTSYLRRMGAPEESFVEEDLLPKIYVITPTHARPVQKAELVRLQNVFLHVPALHWIIVEDAAARSQLVADFLLASRIPFTHLCKETPPSLKLKHDDPRWYKPKGVLQRNEGIRWLREETDAARAGVVYFADDDNTYSVTLFHEMRYTAKVSVWPVGLVGGVMVERPSVNSEGVVDGWLVGWRSDRAFATDMAGFAVNLQLLLTTPDALFSHKSKRGFLESDFLERLVARKELEPKANRCTKVLVWHTQTKDPKLKDEHKLRERTEYELLKIEV